MSATESSKVEFQMPTQSMEEIRQDALKMILYVLTSTMLAFKEGHCPLDKLLETSKQMGQWWEQLK